MPRASFFVAMVMRAFLVIVRSPAVVADVLGELVEAQDLAHEGLEAFSLFDGGQILTEYVLYQGDLGRVAFHADTGKFGQTGLLGCLVAALAGNDDQIGAVGVDS